MRVADYVVEALERAGIGHVFTVCGGGSIFLNDALRKAKRIRYVACHHEQAAAMAAEGYARVRNGLGCAMVTSGPGGTNAITGVAGAWTDHVPLIVISGQVFSTQTIGSRPPVSRGSWLVASETLRTLGVQEINIVDLVRPVTKYAHMVKFPQLIRFHLEKALWLARDGRPGPVWLDIPADVQNSDVNPDELTGFTPSTESRAPSPESVSLLVAWLRAARRPLLHIGQGVRIAGAEEELWRFVNRTGIPVVTARNGNDLVDSGHPCYVGRPGTFAQRGANFAVQTCDLYLAVGTRLSLAQTGYNAKDYAKQAKVVMVDIDRAELDKNTLHVDLKIQADARLFMEAMNNALGLGIGDLGLRNPPSSFLNPAQQSRWSDWLLRCKDWQRRYPVVLPEYRTQAHYVNSYHLVDVLSEQLTEHDVVVTDMGFAFQNTHQAFRVKAGQRLFTNCGLAAMGWGLPAAIGAAIGCEDMGLWSGDLAQSSILNPQSRRRVILIAGDGGLMFNLQELATLAHHRLPVKVFVLDNGGYLTMRQSQAHAFDGYMGSDKDSGLSFPDFLTLADAFGLPVLTLEHSHQVEQRVSWALEHDGPCLVHVWMDPDQATAPKSINRRDPDGTIRQTAIEDAWPYLDRDVLEQEMRVED